MAFAFLSWNVDNFVQQNSISRSFHSHFDRTLLITEQFKSKHMKLKCNVYWVKKRFSCWELFFFLSFFFHHFYSHSPLALTYDIQSFKNKTFVNIQLRTFSCRSIVVAASIWHVVFVSIVFCLYDYYVCEWL